MKYYKVLEDDMTSRDIEGIAVMGNPVFPNKLLRPSEMWHGIYIYRSILEAAIMFYYRIDYFRLVHKDLDHARLFEVEADILFDTGGYYSTAREICLLNEISLPKLSYKYKASLARVLLGKYRMNALMEPIHVEKESISNFSDYYTVLTYSSTIPEVLFKLTRSFYPYLDLYNLLEDITIGDQCY
jgi:hypothetical protein